MSVIQDDTVLKARGRGAFFFSVLCLLIILNWFISFNIVLTEFSLNSIKLDVYKDK